MKYNTLYDVVALVFAVIIIVDHATSCKTKSRRNNYFKMMAVLDLTIIALDMLTAWNETRAGTSGSGRWMLPASVYCVVYALFFFVGCKYFEAMILAEGQKTGAGRSAAIVFAIQFFLLTLNYSRGFYFSYNNGERLIGPRYWLCIGMNLLFVLIMCISTLRHRNCFSQQNRTLFFLMLILTVTSGVSQFLVYYGIVAGGYGTTISLMTVMFTIQRSESERLVNVLNEYNDSLEMLLREKSRQLNEVQGSIINGMADIIAGKESYCEGHTARTTAIATMITSEMKMDPLIRRERSFYNCVIKAVPLHDIGEISISDEILDHYGNLSPEEFKIYQTHTIAGAEAVHRIFANTNDTEIISVAENITRYHHENYDGSGYPDGLRGEEIPLEARIVSMAEAFDFFMSSTEEKNRNDVAKALKMIWDNMNKYYDPALVRFLFASREAICRLYEEQFPKEEQKEASL